MRADMIARTLEHVVVLDASEGGDGLVPEEFIPRRASAKTANKALELGLPVAARVPTPSPPRHAVGAIHLRAGPKVADCVVVALLVVVRVLVAVLSVERIRDPLEYGEHLGLGLLAAQLERGLLRKRAA